jgi:hypothetical protein
MSQVTINGKTFNIPNGSSISVIGDTITVDGKPFVPDEDTGPLRDLEIKWDGPLASLKVQGSNVKVTCGDVQGDVNAAGSVDCGAVEGSVDCGGSINCGDVGKNVDAGGSVNCKTVKGSVDAGGSVIGI